MEIQARSFENWVKALLWMRNHVGFQYRRKKNTYWKANSQRHLYFFPSSSWNIGNTIFWRAFNSLGCQLPRCQCFEVCPNPVTGWHFNEEENSFHRYLAWHSGENNFHEFLTRTAIIKNEMGPWHTGWGRVERTLLHCSGASKSSRVSQLYT